MKVALIEIRGTEKFRQAIAERDEAARARRAGAAGAQQPGGLAEGSDASVAAAN